MPRNNDSTATWPGGPSQVDIQPRLETLNMESFLTVLRSPGSQALLISAVAYGAMLVMQVVVTVIYLTTLLNGR